jgi:parvulin-like peptidyl-prolyl isomerase
MQLSKNIRHYLWILFIAIFVFMIGCSEDDQPTPAADNTATEPGTAEETGASATATTAPEPTPPEPTQIPPTLTPAEPLAALVNDQPVFLSDFEIELARYERAQQELGLEPANGGDNNHQIVLDALIEKELISQASESMGIVVTEEMVETRLLELEEASGGPEELATWLEANQWSIEDFRYALRSEMVAEMAVEIVTADVPTEVEQVHARYLQVDDEALAQSILEQLRNGADFITMAKQYSLDRMTGEVGGDLGYFAAGSLLVPEVEFAAFGHQPGEISDVVPGTRADGTGQVYYIVQVIERDPQRRLTADLRFTLLQDKFESWLEDQWLMARITRFIDSSG